MHNLHNYEIIHDSLGMQDGLSVLIADVNFCLFVCLFFVGGGRNLVVESVQNPQKWNFGPLKLK